MIRTATSWNDVQDAMPDVDSVNVPHTREFNMWRWWVRWELGCDDDGRFIGWCPLHDNDKGTEGSAGYNFRKGTFDCMGDPLCHPNKRGITIVDLGLELATRYLNG